MLKIRKTEISSSSENNGIARGWWFCTILCNVSRVDHSRGIRADGHTGRIIFYSYVLSAIRHENNISLNVFVGAVAKFHPGPPRRFNIILSYNFTYVFKKYYYKRIHGFPPDEILPSELYHPSNCVHYRPVGTEEPLWPGAPPPPDVSTCRDDDTM